jgi:hypothetical protein
MLTFIQKLAIFLGYSLGIANLLIAFMFLITLFAGENWLNAFGITF